MLRFTLFVFVSYSLWSHSDPVLALSSARRCCFMRHLRHLCSQDKSRINQTPSLIMCAWLKGGKRGFRLNSPCVNLSVTRVIWRSVNTGLLSRWIQSEHQLLSCLPAGWMSIEESVVSLFSTSRATRQLFFKSVCLGDFAQIEIR